MEGKICSNFCICSLKKLEQCYTTLSANLPPVNTSWISLQDSSPKVIFHFLCGTIFKLRYNLYTI